MAPANQSDRFPSQQAAAEKRGTFSLHIIRTSLIEKQLVELPRDVDRV